MVPPTTTAGLIAPPLILWIAYKAAVTAKPMAKPWNEFPAVVCSGNIEEYISERAKCPGTRQERANGIGVGMHDYFSATAAVAGNANSCRRSGAHYLKEYIQMASAVSIFHNDKLQSVTAGCNALEIWLPAYIMATYMAPMANGARWAMAGAKWLWKHLSYWTLLINDLAAGDFQNQTAWSIQSFIRTVRKLAFARWKVVWNKM